MHQADESSLIDMDTFNQILELDEDDTRDFSSEMVWSYFTQASSTFLDMDSALCVRPTVRDRRRAQR